MNHNRIDEYLSNFTATAPFINQAILADEQAERKNKYDLVFFSILSFLSFVGLILAITLAFPLIRSFFDKLFLSSTIPKQAIVIVAHLMVASAIFGLALLVYTILTTYSSKNTYTHS